MKMSFQILHSRRKQEKCHQVLKWRSSLFHTHMYRRVPLKPRREEEGVLKSRTFVDDEGCIVTEKGYESESYSEGEDDFQAPKQAIKNSFPAKLPVSHREDEKKVRRKTSVNANKGTKQASIMDFSKRNDNTQQQALGLALRNNKALSDFLLVIITDSAEIDHKNRMWSCHVQVDKHFNFWWYHYSSECEYKPT
ncbi:hypothetical protein INR49_009321 [Caranx melampygus]|nr:hypothetical protein INR49_009321 [Caranx melampygus]